MRSLATRRRRGSDGSQLQLPAGHMRAGLEVEESMRHAHATCETAFSRPAWHTSHVAQTTTPGTGCQARTRTITIIAEAHDADLRWRRALCDQGRVR